MTNTLISTIVSYRIVTLSNCYVWIARVISCRCFVTKRLELRREHI